jgi:hypothetical protein|tara:strand:+ start:214 stop:561 length:348 start_codon:yes stop_codon:yes gene_type:complete
LKSRDLKNKIKIIENLLDNQSKLLNFFFSDLTKYKILLTVIKNHYQNINQTIEEVIENLPSGISSRAHKFNCISDAANNGYLIKENCKSDLRKKFLIPSEELVNEYENYLKIFNE